MFVFDCSPEVLIHDGVVVTLDGHLLEVDVEIVAAKNGGGALRVHRGLNKVGARIFKVFRPSAQTGGKFAQPVKKDKNFPILCLLHIINNIATFRAVALNTLSLSLTDSQTSGQNLRK